MSDELINKIYTKVEEIAKDVVDIKINQARHEEILIKQEENLKYHIKRTDLLQDALKDDRNDSDVQFLEIKEEIKPLQKVYTYGQGFLKLISVLAAIAGVYHFISKLFHS